LRAPISESLSRLDRGQLQKFAQYMIHELQDRQILPTAQRLLDELLSTLPTAINSLDGAPGKSHHQRTINLGNYVMLLGHQMALLGH